MIVGAEWQEIESMALTRGDEFISYTMLTTFRAVWSHIYWLAKQGRQEQRKMGKKLEKVRVPQVMPAVNGNQTGINKLLRQSYAIMAGVCRGEITASTAVAAARNCDNILKGLALRARYGPEALRF